MTTTRTVRKIRVKRDIELKRRSDWHWTIRIKKTDGTPLDTTGYDMSMIIRSRENGEIYDALSISNGKIVHTPSNGQFNLNLTKAEIDEYDFASAEYDIGVTDASGGNSCPFYGDVTVI